MKGNGKTKVKKRPTLYLNDTEPVEGSSTWSLGKQFGHRRWFKKHMDKFLEIYRGNDCNGPAAARRMRIPMATIQAWRDDLPWFKESMDAAVDEVFSDARSTVFKDRNKARGAQWLLLYHAKGREMGFGQRISVDEKKELTLTMRMQVDQLKQVYSRSELEQLYELLNKAPKPQEPPRLVEPDEGGDRSAADSQCGAGSGGDLPGSLH